jgi:DNA polymerase V
MLALIDVNSFYASCEQVFRPDLRGKPVVVLSNNDGCVIAANREAKALNIPMWKPAYQSLPLLQAHHVAVFSSNYPLYGDMSQRVMETLATLSPSLEIYSIDEAFLEVPQTHSDLIAYGQLLRQRVYQWTGLPVGVGIAPTKALTKIASKMAKRQPDRSRHVFVIPDDTTRETCLRATPVADIWGIGKRIARRLTSKGIHTAWDFTQLPDVWIRRELTVVGLRLKRELEGTPQLDLEIYPPAKQMIGTAKSFGHNLKDPALIQEALAWYVAEVAEKLRKQNRIASRMTVFIETNPFRESDPQYSNQTLIKLPVPTDDTTELCHHARIGLDRIYRPGYAYKKVGIWLSGLVVPSAVQQHLFDPDPKPRRQHLMQVMDSLNAKYGKATLRTASAGFRRPEWKLKQERLSPCYTTRLSEIMEIGTP